MNQRVAHSLVGQAVMNNGTAKTKAWRWRSILLVVKRNGKMKTINDFCRTLQSDMTTNKLQTPNSPHAFPLPLRVLIRYSSQWESIKNIQKYSQCAKNNCLFRPKTAHMVDCFVSVQSVKRNTNKLPENMTSLAEGTTVLREQLIMQPASGLHLGLNLQMYSAVEDWGVYDFDLGHRLPPPPPSS